MKIRTTVSSSDIFQEVSKGGDITFLRKSFLPLISLLAIVTLYLGINYYKIDLGYILDRQSICLFISILVLSNYALKSETSILMLSKAFLFALALQTIFIRGMIAPFIIECVYTVWLISRLDRRGLFLRLLNLIISISLMMILFSDPGPLIGSPFFEKGILLIYITRCAFVNFEYDNEPLLNYADVIFPYLSAYLFLGAVHFSAYQLIVFFLPVISVFFLFVKPKVLFLELMGGQFFMFATTGLIQSILLLILLARVPSNKQVGELTNQADNILAIVYMTLIMFFLYKTYSQHGFSMDFLSVLSWQWVFAGLFFVHTYRKKYLKILIIITLVYLFY